MKTKLILSILLFPFLLDAQVAINPTGKDPHPSAMLDVESTSKGILIPRMDSTTRKNIPDPAIGLMVFDTTTNSFWFNGNRGWKKVKDDDSKVQSLSINGDTIFLSQSNYIVIPQLSYLSIQKRLDEGECPLEIYGSGIPLSELYGKKYQGGLIFYLDTQDTIPGLKGLVCAPTDVSSPFAFNDFSIRWECPNIDIPGADGITIGTGSQNTIDIEAACTIPNTPADFCSNLSIDGYSDWFLPSKDELFIMWENLYLNGRFGSFTNSSYWSSTEANETSMISVRFSFGDFVLASKGTNLLRVRAIRAF